MKFTAFRRRRLITSLILISIFVKSTCFRDFKMTLLFFNETCYFILCERIVRFEVNSMAYNTLIFDGKLYDVRISVFIILSLFERKRMLIKRLDIYQ